MANIYKYTVKDSHVIVTDENDNQIDMFNIPAERSKIITISNSTVTINRSDNTEITTLEIVAQDDDNFIVQDSKVTIKDNDDNILDVIYVKADEEQEFSINVSGTGGGTVEIKDTDGTTLYTKSVSQGVTITQTINDSKVIIKRSNNTIIDTKSVKAQDVDDYIIQDSEVTVIVKNQNGDTLENKKYDILADDVVSETINIADTDVRIEIRDDTTNDLIDFKNLVLDSGVDNGTEVIKITQSGGCDNMIYGIFNEDEDTMPTLTIIEELAGEYTTVDTSNVGTLTFKINGITETLPFDLYENDVLSVVRSSYSTNGWFKLY